MVFIEHGSHNHSHGKIGRSTSRLTQMVAVNATDENETEEASLQPPPLPKAKAKNSNESSESMNMRGIFLHVLADALGSVIVIASALVRTYALILFSLWEKLRTWFDFRLTSMIKKLTMLIMEIFIGIFIA